MIYSYYEDIMVVKELILVWYTQDKNDISFYMRRKHDQQYLFMDNKTDLILYTSNNWYMTSLKIILSTISLLPGYKMIVKVNNSTEVKGVSFIENMNLKCCKNNRYSLP